MHAGSVLLVLILLQCTVRTHDIKTMIARTSRRLLWKGTGAKTIV